MSTVIQKPMVEYPNWNSLALRHFFAGDDGIPLDSLDVSDESLVRIAGSGNSLLRAVRKHLKSTSDLMGRWKFQAQIGQQPEYFAFLLATCRIEWQRDAGQFAEHFQSWLEVNPQPWIAMLPNLWLGLEKFLTVNSDAWRPLVLPDYYSSYTNIGHTIGMIFPRRTDRRRLSDMFDGLSERDPSLPSVCAGLESIREELSKECREQADYFRMNVVSSPNDPQVVRFWRVLRQSLECSSTFQHEKAIQPDVVLTFWIDDDGLLEPWCLLKDESEVPRHFELLDGAIGIAGWSRVLALKGSDCPSGMPLFTEEDDDIYQLLSDRNRLYFERGVIPLIEVESIDGVSCLTPQFDSSCKAEAHVMHGKSELLQLVRSAGMRTEVLGDTHWRSCFGAASIEQQSMDCRLRERLPRIEIYGLRFGQNQYLNLPGFRPRLECDGASRFELTIEGLTANPSVETQVGDYWGETTITAKSSDGNPLAKRVISLLRDLPPVLTGQWSVFKQPYWLPAATPRVGARSADTPYPSFMEGPVCKSAPDTTNWQTDEIWLGPRVGDVSSQRCPGFEWKLSEAADGRTRLVCYVGDALNPVLPSLESVNINKASCRLWRRAFDPKQTRCLNPEWSSILEQYATLRDPRIHKSKLGRDPGKFEGDPPPARKKIPFTQFETEVHAGTRILETVLRARISGKQAPLSWRSVWDDAAKAFDLQLEPTKCHSFLANILRAWQETGVFDVAGTAWGGSACLVRRPRFILRRIEDQLVGVLVGLASEQLRRVVQEEAINAGWEFRLKFSRSQYVPPIPEIRKVFNEGAFLAELSNRLGLGAPEFLQWEDTTDLPECISDLRDVTKYWDKYDVDLPICSPTWKKTIGNTEVQVAKYNPPRQPPVWTVGPSDRRWAICTSSDWAWRLACLRLSGSLPFNYSLGCINRISDTGVEGIPVTSVYLPVEVGRLLTIIANTLPGPTPTSGYEYFAPSDISGSILADRLSLQTT